MQFSNSTMTSNAFNGEKLKMSSLPGSFEVHIVPGTHWDREWRHDFEEMRQRLIYLVDNTLDGQYMPIRDYLEMRPQNRSRLEKFIRSGRLLIGPWYSLPDMTVTLGESTVRNLFYGIRNCRQLGHVMMEGLTNSSWGQISQMPQILKGFGIDTYASYHGVPGHLLPIEFWWESPDGSRVLFIRSPGTTRAGFWLAERKALAPKPEETECAGAGSELLANAYRLADARTVDSTPLYGDDTQRAVNYDRLYDEFSKYVELIRPETTTGQILMGELIDAQQSPPDLVKMVEYIRRHHTADSINLSSIPIYFNKVKESIGDLEVFKGEMRFPHKKNFAFRLCSVLATRLYLKQANRACEHLLTKWTEPLSAMAWLHGRDYPVNEIDNAWEMMLTNLAHDAIGGCSIEDVHADMLWRYKQVQNRCRALLHRSVGHLASKISSHDIAPDQSRLIVFNPLPHPRTEIVEAYVDIPVDVYKDGITIKDQNNNNVACNVIATSMPKSVSLELQIIGCPALPVRRAHIEFEAKNIPAIGYAQYTLQSAPPAKPAGHGLTASDTRIENEHLRMTVNPDGSIDLFDKDNDLTFPGIHYFEDSGMDRAARNSWYLIPPENDTVITSLGTKAQSLLIYCSPLQAKLKVIYTMRIPRSIDTEDVTIGRQEHFTTYRYKHRSPEMVDLNIESTFILRRNAKRIDVETTLINNAMDHRLRIMFPTHVATDQSWADAPFDVLTRPIAKLKTEEWAELRDLGQVQTYPMLSFVDLASDDRSLALLVDALPEYDVLEDEKRTIAVTLLRAIFHGRLDPETTMPLTNSSQCLGKHSFRYSIYPHKGNWEQGRVYNQAQLHALPPLPAQCMGKGTGVLPPSGSFISFEPASIDVSVIKKAHNENTVIVRVFNPSSKNIKAVMNTAWTVKNAYLVNLLEEEKIADLRTQDNKVFLDIPAKAIRTISFEPAV